MDKELAESFYSRENVQKKILDFAKSREVGTRYDGFFGKRPDVIENVYDVKKFVKKGIFSFHASCERWANPLMLSNQNLSDEEKAKNRTGWDLILDLDGVDYKFAQIAGNEIVNFLDELGVKNVTVKFSGNKGFHIGVPFEAFSSEIIGIGKTKNLFPEAPRKIASFLMHELKGRISKKILENSGSVEEISKKYEIPLEDLISDDLESYNFNFLKVIEIDTILITSRHLFRMPYSLHEKSSLVSIPVAKNRILDFKKHEANPDLVKTEKYEEFDFLKYKNEFGKDADILLLKSYEDDYEEMISSSINLREKSGDFIIEINEKVDMKDFPETIKFALEHNFLDGKKRALFLILTFLYSINYSDENIDEIVESWNQRQETSLKKNYIQAQLSWFKVREKQVSPPNFENDNYFKGIGIPQQIIDKDVNRFKNKKAKNPLHYVYLFLKTKNNKK